VPARVQRCPERAGEVAYTPFQRWVFSGHHPNAHTSFSQELEIRNEELSAIDSFCHSLILCLLL
jgi:hypothetical protein